MVKKGGIHVFKFSSNKKKKNLLGNYLKYDICIKIFLYIVVITLFNSSHTFFYKKKFNFSKKVSVFMKINPEVVLSTDFLRIYIRQL